MIALLMLTTTVVRGESDDHGMPPARTGELGSRSRLIDNMSALGRVARDAMQALREASRPNPDGNPPTIEELAGFLDKKLGKSQRVAIPYIDQAAITDLEEVLHPPFHKQLEKEQIADVKKMVQSILALRESAQKQNLKGETLEKLDLFIRVSLSRLNDAVLGITPLDFSIFHKHMLAIGRMAVPNFDDQHAQLILAGATFPVSSPAIAGEKKELVPEEHIKDILRGLYVLQPLPDKSAPKK